MDTLPAGPRPGTLGTPTGVAGVRLVVRDLDRVARFYAEVVGLQPIRESDGRMTMGAGGTALLQLEHRPGARLPEPHEAGLYHTAFLLPARSDLGAWLAHAARRGVTLDGAADHLVSEAAYIHDPEGNGIEVYADRPRSTWPWQDGQLQMANSRLDHAGLVAAAAQPWAGAPDGTIVGHVHLRVGDAGQAAAFLVHALGLDVTRAGPNAAFLSWGGYHHHIAANNWDSAGAGPRDPDAAGLAAVVLHAPGTGRVQDPWGTWLDMRSSAEQETTR